MVEEDAAFKDEATKELEEFLMRQVESAVRSELGPIVDDLVRDFSRALQDLKSDLDRRDKDYHDGLGRLEAELKELKWMTKLRLTRMKRRRS